MVCEDSLRYNRIGEDGATALVPALRGLTALQLLEYVYRCRAVVGVLPGCASIVCCVGLGLGLDAVVVDRRVRRLVCRWQAWLLSFRA